MRTRCLILAPEYCEPPNGRVSISRIAWVPGIGVERLAAGLKLDIEERPAGSDGRRLIAELAIAAFAKFTAFDVGALEPIGGHDGWAIHRDAVAKHETSGLPLVRRGVACMRIDQYRVFWDPSRNRPGPRRSRPLAFEGLSVEGAGHFAAKYESRLRD